MCLDVLNSNYTFVNERLARHYGIPNIYGSDFRRVTVEKERARPARPGKFPDHHFRAESNFTGDARLMDS